MTKSDDLGKLILRVALGVLILLHGIAKLSKGVDGIGGMLSSHGLPAILAYLVYVGEVVAPVLLIVGLFTRPAAWAVAANMVVAIWLVHMKDLGALNNQGGWASAAASTERLQSSSAASRPGNSTSVKPKRLKSRTRIG